MATWQQINDIIWAIDKLGDPTNLLKPGDPNVITTGWPQGKPNRQYFNWILQECHNNISFLETNGWPSWDSSTEYDSYAIVRFGTKHYISLQSANENNSPDTETSWWKDYFVWLTEQAGTEQTNTTVANFNDGYYYPHPSFINGTTVNLTNAKILLTDLGLYELDTNPLSITVPTTVANTWYYIYVDIPAGSDVVAGDISITTVVPAFDHTKGMFISGTKRCIGYIEGNHTGNGEAEPYIVADGWYQRRDEKKRIALYTPPSQSNTTLYSGAPNFAGPGMVEIASAVYESQAAAMAFADSPGFVGNISDSDLTDYTDPGYDLGYNGQGVGGVSTDPGEAAGVAINTSALVPVDSSSNIIVACHGLIGGTDEMMAFWLKRFQLPRGIFSR